MLHSRQGLNLQNFSLLFKLEIKGCTGAYFSSLELTCNTLTERRHRLGLGYDINPDNTSSAACGLRTLLRDKTAVADGCTYELGLSPPALAATNGASSTAVFFAALVAGDENRSSSSSSSSCSLIKLFLTGVSYGH